MKRFQAAPTSLSLSQPMPAQTALLIRFFWCHEMRHFRPTKRFPVNMGADTIRAATGSEQVDKTAGLKREGERKEQRERGREIASKRRPFSRDYMNFGNSIGL